ncbi:hypothetical protein THAOC_10107 [Thalassiosira oceanica]|uniref:Uncharacterized protein n=1 Tax=Thalassiosira oceanica TaxID=159749 RepID=K0T5Z9_THAOC|nr:hypothetical protein THAOC_10107 [Thalassiosira oceanica]|eukprot:EJK68691.1 hypothetical protein THAOC_10107 [Thalassiosira oceanica]
MDIAGGERKKRPLGWLGGGERKSRSNSRASLANSLKNDDFFFEDEETLAMNPATEHTQSPNRTSSSDEDNYESSSFPGTAATSLATSADLDIDSVEQMGGVAAYHKRKSMLSLPLALIPSKTALNCADEEETETDQLSRSKFDEIISVELESLAPADERSPVDFDANPTLRHCMEPYLAVARLRREEARQQALDTLKTVQEPSHSLQSSSTCFDWPSIGSSYGVPYPSLRTETPFLFDVDSYPLADALAETLGTHDLSQLHLKHPLSLGKGKLLEPLQNREKRRNFHQYSVGNISYHIPLTPAYGTNALYAESRPGREDWHPLAAKSFGLGYQFDGVRCLHFNLKNETDITRVSLNFRIGITRLAENGDRYDMDDQLCCPELLQDRYSCENLEFYDEVVVQVGASQRTFASGPICARRSSVSVIG